METIEEVVNCKRIGLGFRRIFTGICGGCLETFYSTSKETIWCSIACAITKPPISHVCKSCESIFYRPARDADRKPRYCSRKCFGFDNQGPKHFNWRGGHLTEHGYRRVRISGRNVLEHRLVMSSVIKRPLEKFENVHHINGIRNDNRPENLELWAKVQPKGQRVKDLVSFVVNNYRKEVEKALSQ